MRPTFARSISGLLMIAAVLAAAPPPEAEAGTVDRRIDSLAMSAPLIEPRSFVITRDSIGGQMLIEPLAEYGSPPAPSASRAVRTTRSARESSSVRDSNATIAAPPLTAREVRSVRARPTSLPKADDFDHWLFLIPFVGMTALAKDRDTRQRRGDVVARGVAAGQKIFAGAITVTNAAGFVEKGTTALAKKPFGRAKETVDNTAGANGDLNVTVERDGWYCYVGDGSITAADIGNPCFIVDDQTVADTDGAGTRSRLGLIRDVDAFGVWVQFD